MKWIAAKVIFDSEDTVLARDLISDLFYEMGLSGVVMEEKDIDPDADWGEDALPPPGHDAVIGYIPLDYQVEEKCTLLENRLALLEKKAAVSCRLAYEEIDQKDWAEAWKAYFWPEKISKRIVVKPTWREYDARPGEIILEIDPGMAFGTGTHPSTTLCIHMIERYLKPGNSFLDVGTGSGILLIAAAKLGADKVWGTDNDETAVTVAGRNLMQNRIDEARCKIIQCDLVEAVEERFDFVVANITAKTVQVLLGDVKRVLSDGGIFACSGILEENRTAVKGRMKDLGFQIVDERNKEAWVSIAGKI